MVIAGISRFFNSPCLSVILPASLSTLRTSASVIADAEVGGDGVPLEVVCARTPVDTADASTRMVMESFFIVVPSIGRIDRHAWSRREGSAARHKHRAGHRPPCRVNQLAFRARRCRRLAGVVRADA